MKLHFVCVGLATAQPRWHQHEESVPSMNIPDFSRRDSPTPTSARPGFHRPTPMPKTFATAENLRHRRKTFSTAGVVRYRGN